MTFDNQRPGVYSRYDVSSAYVTPRSAGAAAVVARASGCEPGRLYEITGTAPLSEVFPPDGEDAHLRGCVQILLQSGVSRVYAVAVEEDFYEDALALIEEVSGIGAVVCDCEDSADRRALLASVLRSSDNLRERIGFCGVEAEEAEEAARELNSERAVLCCPAVRPIGGAGSHPVYGAAALAGKVLVLDDPVWNFSGEPLATVLEPASLPEARVQSLLAAGVTVLEEREGAVECVRALTSRTRSGDETDYSLRGLNAVLCIDRVMTDLRAGLRATMRGTRISGQSLQAVRSQVAVLLGEKQDAGILEEFDAPVVRSSDSDPAVCEVELSFRIAHVVSQIHVTAHIQV